MQSCTPNNTFNQPAFAQVHMPVYRDIDCQTCQTMQFFKQKGYPVNNSPCDAFCRSEPWKGANYELCQKIGDCTENFKEKARQKTHGTSSYPLPVNHPLHPMNQSHQSQYKPDFIRDQYF